MSNTFFISDHHFYHSNILTFRDQDENLIRPDFFDVYEMNEFMIERWNSVVGVNDKVYHLGDVLMSTARNKFESILPRLNGTKVLIKGNHDNAKLSIYADYFKDVRSEVGLKLDQKAYITFTHRPIRLHEENEHSGANPYFNVHGHIHQNVIDDRRYLNVSVENINYTPISIEELKEHFYKTFDL